MQNKVLRTSALILGISLFFALESAQAMDPEYLKQWAPNAVAQCQHECRNISVDDYSQKDSCMQACLAKFQKNP